MQWALVVVVPVVAAGAVSREMLIQLAVGDVSREMLALVVVMVAAWCCIGGDAASVGGW